MWDQFVAAVCLYFSFPKRLNYGNFFRLCCLSKRLHSLTLLQFHLSSCLYELRKQSLSNSEQLFHLNFYLLTRKCHYMCFCEDKYLICWSLGTECVRISRLNFIYQTQGYLRGISQTNNAACFHFIYLRRSL